MRGLVLLLALLASTSFADVIYNGSDYPFSAGGPWDANGSSLVESNASPYSAPNHLRANIVHKNWWGAAVYLFKNWDPLDISAAKSISFYAKASEPVSVLLQLNDKDGGSSSRSSVDLTTSYKRYTVTMTQFTGFNASKATGIVFAISTAGTKTYTLDIDDIEYERSGPDSDIPAIRTSAEVQAKAYDLALALRGKPLFMIGAGGVDTKDLKLDIYYKYLVRGWRKWNAPDGEYANIITRIADGAGAVPMFTYYFLAYQFETKNYDVLTSPMLHEYLQDLRLLFQKMGAYGKPVILHMEPDFFGYLQQYAVKQNKPASQLAAKIRYDDIPECKTMPENVGGLFDCIITMSRTLSPKAKIGYHASMWADWFDPKYPQQIPDKTRSIANFLLSLSGNRTDFVTVETVDRDAGFLEVTRGDKGAYCNQRCFDLHFSWTSHITAAMNKPVLWWQMPFGVPSNSPGYDYHYRDNRVPYFFGNLNLAIDIGGVGMVYGAGADKQTTPDTDGGQFKRATDEYAKSPAMLRRNAIETCKAR